MFKTFRSAEIADLNVLNIQFRACWFECLRHSDQQAQLNYSKQPLNGDPSSTNARNVAYLITPAWTHSAKSSTTPATLLLYYHVAGVAPPPFPVPRQCRADADRRSLTAEATPDMTTLKLAYAHWCRAIFHEHDDECFWNIISYATRWDSLCVFFCWSS